GVGRERLHVPPLAFGVQGVEGKRRLSGPGQARDDDELVARDPQVDVLEVVLASPVNLDECGMRAIDWGLRVADCGFGRVVGRSVSSLLRPSCHPPRTYSAIRNLISAVPL